MWDFGWFLAVQKMFSNLIKLIARIYTKLNLHLNGDDLAGIHLDSQEDGVIADEGSSR